MSDSEDETHSNIIKEFMEITNESEEFAKSYLGERSWNLKHCLSSYFEQESRPPRKRKAIELSGDSDDDLPEAAVCQKLVEEFETLTNTDEACAQFYLQDHQWDLQRSLNAFFEKKVSQTLEETKPSKTETEVLCISDDDDASDNSMKLITWNVDGLDGRNLNIRTKAVCKVIKMESPDVVFLQEVIPDTYRYLKSHLPGYACLPANDTDYFTVMCLRKSTVTYQNHNVKPFTNSTMGRNLLVANVIFHGIPLRLMTSHLESTKEYSAERINQLKVALTAMRSAMEGSTVIFGGDLNLRDKEIDHLGGLPSYVEDLWISCGRRTECAYTWDAVRNVNIQLSSRYRPRLRFDRVYISHSKPPALKPKHFGLVGIEKIHGTQCFPSDHWGISVSFDL